MTRKACCYVVEWEARPGKWQPLQGMLYTSCADARLACDLLRKAQSALAYRVTRWVRDGDGLTHGRKRS